MPPQQLSVNRNSTCGVCARCAGGITKVTAYSTSSSTRGRSVWVQLSLGGVTFCIAALQREAAARATEFRTQSAIHGHRRTLEQHLLDSHMIVKVLNVTDRARRSAADV